MYHLHFTIDKNGNTIMFLAKSIIFDYHRQIHSSSAQSVESPHSSVGMKAVHQVSDVRYVEEGHFPIWFDRTGKKRYKHSKKSDTQVVCSKCDNFLPGGTVQVQTLQFAIFLRYCI